MPSWGKPTVCSSHCTLLKRSVSVLFCLSHEELQLHVCDMTKHQSKITFTFIATVALIAAMQRLILTLIKKTFNF